MARGGGGGGFYAVASGRREGIFSTWSEAEAAVKGHSGAKFKKFPTFHEAQAYITAYGSAPAHRTSASSSNSSHSSDAGAHVPSRKHARSSENYSATHAPAAKRAHVGNHHHSSSNNSTSANTPQVFYAVAEGHNTSVVTSWSQVLSLTDGYDRPVFRKFSSREAAEAFLAGYALPSRRDGATLRPDSRRSVEPKSPRAGTATPTATTTDTTTLVPTTSISNASSATTAPRASHTDDLSHPERPPLLPERFWYAVAKGRATGVFETWYDAKKHVDGLFSARYKKFPSREEAEAFVAQHRESTGSHASDPDPQHPDSLVAFCDGSALQNGRRGCQAGYACVFPHTPAWNVATKLVEPRATNNRAEYFAALEAMKRANFEDPTHTRVLFIFSDSMLLIRSMTEWLDTWRRNAWRKADGAPVLNRDILEQLVAAQGSRRIVWRHVKAHTGRKDWCSTWNDAADQAARRAASS